MIDKINTLRAVAKNLTSHLFMEGKTKITKPGVIIPGAVAATGVVVTLETKDNNAGLVIHKGNTEIQRAAFNYDETPEGYELVSAKSLYFYDDKNNKELQQKQYIIEPKLEKIYEYYINYTDAPIKETTRACIDEINSSMAQVAGYKSDKTEYDEQESHTYGKKSLQRDIPALLKFLDIIAPDAEFTLRLKDKLKKDHKTSLVAFEANNTENGKEIVKGFMSTNGDSFSYHIDTKDLTIIGEQGSNITLSRAYLKPENTAAEQAEVSNEPAETVSEGISAEQAASENVQTKETASADTKEEDKEEGKQIVTGNVSGGEQKTQTEAEKTNHVHPAEHYTSLIFDVAANKKYSTRKKVEMYKEILACAYLDGYNDSELENILLGNGLHKFSYYCKKTYVREGIQLAKKGNLNPPVRTLDDKIKELKNLKTDIEDDGLKICIQSMINDIKKIQDNAVKEAFVDKALNLLKNNSSKNFKSDLISFVQESGKINDDFKLHYEIYVEYVSNLKIRTLKSKIEQMINKISDADNYEKRDEFLTQLYMAKNTEELEQLQKEVQKLLNEQHSLQKNEESSEIKLPKKLSIKSLSHTNQKYVKKLLNCKSPSDITMTFNEIRNLLLDIGFTETGVRGTHHKFLPPLDILFNGQKQSFITVNAGGPKTSNPAQIDDLINVCKQYYGSEKK